MLKQLPLSLNWSLRSLVSTPKRLFNSTLSFMRPVKVAKKFRSGTTSVWMLTLRSKLPLKRRIFLQKIIIKIRRRRLRSQRKRRERRKNRRPLSTISHPFTARQIGLRSREMDTHTSTFTSCLLLWRSKDTISSLEMRRLAKFSTPLKVLSNLLSLLTFLTLEFSIWRMR